MTKHINFNGRWLLDNGLWEDYCEETGTNVWAINEGLLDSDTLLDIPEGMTKEVLRKLI